MKIHVSIISLVLSAVYANSALAGWGAIAVNTYTGAVGFSSHHNSYQEANRAALEQCGNGCEIKSTEHDKCNAYVMNNDAWGSAWGFTTPTEAIDMAMSKCGSHCTLSAWICN